MKNKKNNNGFTLVEIMLAVAVLSIIVVSFSGAFSSGFRSIQQSRNEITNLNESQSELEEKIATEAFDRAQTLNLHFNNQESIEVPGAIVEKNKVRTFLPDVPVITSVSITPDSHIYGLEPEQWNVEIKTRGVEDKSKITVSVYQQNDPDTVLISDNENEIVDESASFSIPIPISISDKESRLTDDLYYFRFEVVGVNGELDKYYTVRGINYLALGESKDGNKKLLASSDHKQWGILEAERAELSSTIDFENIKAGTWGGSVDDRKFVVVGNSGKAFSSNDGVYWKDISTTDIKNYNFEDVIWNGEAFVAAGKDSSTNKAVIIEYDGSNWDTASIELADKSDTIINKLLFIEDGIDGSPSVIFAAGKLAKNINDKFLLYNLNGLWKEYNILDIFSEINQMIFKSENNELFIIEKENDPNLIIYNLEYDTTNNIIKEDDRNYNNPDFTSAELNTASEFQNTKFAFGNSGSAIFYDSDKNKKSWDSFNNIVIDPSEPQIPNLPTDYSNFNANESLAIENDLLILGEKNLGGALGLGSEMYLLEYNNETDNYNWKSLSDLSLLDSDANPLYDFKNDFSYPIIDIISK